MVIFPWRLKFLESVTKTVSGFEVFRFSRPLQYGQTVLYCFILLQEYDL